MDTTISGNTPLLQPIWSEWLNDTRVCSELSTICIPREEPWQKNKNVTPWYQISEKVTMLYASISMFCIFGIQFNPLQKQRSNPVAVQQATWQRRQNPAQVTMYHSINPPTGHENNQVLSLGITKHTCQPGTEIPAERFCGKQLKCFIDFAKWKVPPNLSWCKCKWSEMHVNAFTMIHKSVANTTYVLFRSFCPTSLL